MNNQQIEANKEQRPTDVASSAVLGGRTLVEQIRENSTWGGWIIATPKQITEQLMTGAVKAGVRSDGLVKVQYEDGETEERMATAELLATKLDKINLMALVGFVQDGRESA